MGFCFIIIYLTKTILLLALYYHIILNINMRVLSALTFVGCSVIVGLHRTQNHVLHPSKDLQ